MKRIPLLLPALLLLVAPALAADGVSWCRSFEKAREQAKARGSMILICQVVDDGEAANAAQQEAYRDPAFVRAAEGFVCIFACPNPQAGSEKFRLNGREVECCRGAYGVTLQDSRTAFNDVRRNYADLNTNSAGDTKFPYHFVIDANGKVLQEIANGEKEGGFDVVPAAQFAAALNGLIAQHGKGLTTSEFEELDALVQKAEAEQKAGNLKSALRLANQVLEKNDRTALADRARKIRDEIAEGGRSEMDAALALVDTDPAGALLALETFAKDYAGTALAKEAKKKLSELKRRPDVKAALAEVAARRTAEKKLGEAEKAVASRKYAKALKALDEIARKFAGTVVGDRAKARAEELRGDPEIAAVAKEQEAAKYCKGWLSLARSFAQNGMNDKAKAKYREIIEKFPSTSYADEARKELEKLR